MPKIDWIFGCYGDDVRGETTSFVQGAVASRRQAPSQCAVKMPGWERVDRGWRASVVVVSTPRLPGRGREADSDGSSKAQLGSAERKCALYVLTAAFRSNWSHLRSRSQITNSVSLKKVVEGPSNRAERCVWRDGRPTYGNRIQERTSLYHSEHPSVSVCVRRSVSLSLARLSRWFCVSACLSLCYSLFASQSRTHIHIRIVSPSLSLSRRRPSVGPSTTRG